MPPHQTRAFRRIRHMPSYLERLTKAGLDLLFPPQCVNCRAAGAYLCAACLVEVQRFTTPVCVRCGRPLSLPQGCSDCFRIGPFLDGVRSAAYFDGPLRTAIHALKYENITALSSTLGALMADAWDAFHPPADIIVPVPLHAQRFRERGYNQSELLARELGRRIGLPVMANVLVRCRPTAQQTALNVEERQRNVANAFETHTGNIAGQAVLLVDDVCTTAATLRACAKALNAAGTASIWALTLARAR